MTDKPLVSILCATYNHEKYIAEAIESFLMQKTSFPVEIVIGEDCSTDKTWRLIQKYAQIDSRIVALKNKTNADADAKKAQLDVELKQTEVDTAKKSTWEKTFG
jgi:glycosyltransferase involved in cell wall biosynthesis